MNAGLIGAKCPCLALSLFMPPRPALFAGLLLLIALLWAPCMVIGPGTGGMKKAVTES